MEIKYEMKSKIIRILGLIATAISADASKAFALDLEADEPAQATSATDEGKASQDLALKELRENTKSTIEPAGDGVACVVHPD